MSTPHRPSFAHHQHGPASRSPYRMLVTDIDGTLLTSDSALPDAVREAVTSARQAGIVVTIATGRRYTTSEKILRDLGLYGPLAPVSIPPASDAGLALQPPPVIMQTGTVIVGADGRGVLHRDSLPRSAARNAMRTLVQAGLQPIAYDDGVIEQHLFTGPPEHDSPAAAAYLASNPHLVTRMPYNRLVDEVAATQIVVVDSTARVEPVLPRLRIADCRNLVSFSGNLESCFLEVFHAGCSKGRAVTALAAYLGMSVDQVVCIGDNWNDVEMLAVAGCGVAVANVEEGVAPYARRLTVSNDHCAVASVLWQMIRGEEPGYPNPAYAPLTPELAAEAD